MKIVSIVGARPQFIKLAPLSKEIKMYHQELIVHTGQHYDFEMSDRIFNDLNIKEPNYNLDVNGGSNNEQTAKMMRSLEKVLEYEMPDLIIVFGDTNSTIAGALTASKMNIMCIHIEAGLRSFNKTMPEEINRIVADHVSDYLFAPTENAIYNLDKENLSDKSYCTGDIMVDVLSDSIKKAEKLNLIGDYSLEKSKYYLLTLHRPYNVDNEANLMKILNILGKIRNRILFPVHPRTRKIIENDHISVPENIIMTSPKGYFEFLNLQMNSLKIITDSGGIQKEAYLLKKPCITLRSETEWVETILSGWNLLIDPNTASDYHENIEQFEPPLEYENLFGENVAQNMLEIINKL